MQTMIITGFVGRDPEEKVTASGKKITSFSMGVNTKKGDEKITSWYKINCWDGNHSKVLSYIKKGSMLTVMGKLNTPKVYTNKLGEDKIDLSITCESIDFIPIPKPIENTSKDLSTRFNNDAIAVRQKELDDILNSSPDRNMDLGF